MSAKESLIQLLETLPEERQRELLDFAEYLRSRDEDAAWRKFGLTQFARAYGPNEPEYSTAELKSGGKT